MSLGMFTPPAFLNIKGNIFIVFGVLCLAAAVQAWFTLVIPFLKDRKCF